MEITDLVLGALLGLLLSLLVATPWVRDFWDRRGHVREVRARLEQVWQPDPASRSATAKVLTGVHLVVINSSRWRVHDLLVFRPPSLGTLARAELAPGETWTQELPLTAAWEKQPVVFQVVDVRGRTWHATTALDKVEPIPAPMPLHARVVQSSARRWPQSAHRAFARLPRPLQRALWGYDPQGKDSDS